MFDYTCVNIAKLTTVVQDWGKLTSASCNVLVSRKASIYRLLLIHPFFDNETSSGLANSKTSGKGISLSRVPGAQHKILKARVEPLILPVRRSSASSTDPNDIGLLNTNGSSESATADTAKNSRGSCSSESSTNGSSSKAWCEMPCMTLLKNAMHLLYLSQVW